MPSKSGDKSKNLTKETLKGLFKYVQVVREGNSFTLTAVTREKRTKSKYISVLYNVLYMFVSAIILYSKYCLRRGI